MTRKHRADRNARADAKCRDSPDAKRNGARDHRASRVWHIANHRNEVGAMRKRLTFANITSFMALFVALSAGSYAATILPNNSVGSKQLKPSAVVSRDIAARAVTHSKIAANAITGSQVVPGSLSGADIDLATLGQVPSAAVAGSAGVARVKTVTAAGTSVAGSDVAVSATCDPGLTVVGGGAKLGDENNQLVNDSYPSGTSGWTVDVFASPSGSAPFTVCAICVPAASTS